MNFKHLIFVVLFILFSKINAQNNSEIINWINAYENNYAIEEILDGTFSDKVFLFLDEEEKLMIKEFSFDGSSSPPVLFWKIDLSKINRIYGEPVKSKSGNRVSVEIKICVEPGYINIVGYKNGRDLPVDFDTFLRENGHCNASIRLNFSADESAKKIERIINAIAALAKNKGSNPKIGSLF